MLAGEKMNVSKYNLINSNNSVIPNYNLENEKIELTVYLNLDKTVCIIGKADNNYCSWLSITNLYDFQINKEIFDFIANNRFNIFSHEYLVLGNEKYREIMDGYILHITRSSIEGKCWLTPFGSYYGEDSRKHHGRFFARDLQNFNTYLQAMCEFRTDDGSYIDILKSYLNILTSGVNYQKVKPLITILQREQYLKLSSNKIIRDLFLDCIKKSDYLYNRYMDEVR